MALPRVKNRGHIEGDSPPCSILLVQPRAAARHPHRQAICWLRAMTWTSRFGRQPRPRPGTGSRIDLSACRTIRAAALRAECRHLGAFLWARKPRGSRACPVPSCRWNAIRFVTMRGRRRGSPGDAKGLADRIVGGINAPDRRARCLAEDSAGRHDNAAATRPVALTMRARRALTARNWALAGRWRLDHDKPARRRINADALARRRSSSFPNANEGACALPCRPEAGAGGDGDYGSSTSSTLVRLCFGSSFRGHARVRAITRTCRSAWSSPGLVTGARSAPTAEMEGYITAPPPIRSAGGHGARSPRAAFFEDDPDPRRDGEQRRPPTGPCWPRWATATGRVIVPCPCLTEAQFPRRRRPEPTRDPCRAVRRASTSAAPSTARRHLRSAERATMAEGQGGGYQRSFPTLILESERPAALILPSD